MNTLGLLTLVLLSLLPSGMTLAQQDADHSMMLRRVKPGVVLILVHAEAQIEVEGRVKVSNYTYRERGSGFIINPNGYIATNGHVVKLYNDANFKDLETGFKLKFIKDEYFQSEIKKIETKKRISDAEKEQLLIKMVNKYFSKITVKNKRKNLYVFLSNGERHHAEVKEYSPPISRMPGKISSSTEGSDKEEEAGKDIAVLKIERNHLPTVKLGDANNLELGEIIYAIGFPEVVSGHDYLSKERENALDASVTDGIVSGLKLNVNKSFIIQTTAPLAQGNSGGPAFNSRGEVIGIATFISIDKATGQAIQGFNFLVPANTAMEFVRRSGVNLQEESLFSKLWFEALDIFSSGNFERALTKLDEVLRVLPGQPDAQKLQVAAQSRVKPGPPVLLIAIAVSLIAIAVGLTAYIPRRRKRETTQASVTFVHQETPAMTPWLGSLVGQEGPLMGKTFSIGGSGVRIGRDPGRNQIAIDDPEVSREHAWVGEENGMMVVRDLNSVNGTFINTTDADRVQNAQLRNGDVIIIGKGNNASFRYQAAHNG